MRHLITFILLFVTLPALANHESHLTPVSIKLHWQHQFQFAGIYAAQEKGFYREAGLSVTILTGQKAPFAEVEAGQVNFGISGAGLVVERLKGRPFVALAAIFQNSPYTWLLREDSTIHSPVDFVGKTVTRQSYADDLSAMLLQDGIHESHLNVIDPSAADIDLLINRKVDALTAYISNEPFWMESRGEPYRTMSPHEFGINFYSDIIFTSETFLQQHPAEVEAFRQASLQGWQYALEHPHEIIDLILSNYNVQNKSRDHLEFEAQKLAELSLYPTVLLGHMTQERWQKIADHYQHLALIGNADQLEGFIYSPPLSISKWLKISLFSLSILAALALIGYLLTRRHAQLLSKKVTQQTAALEAELFKGKALEISAKRESERLQTLLNHTLESVITIDENGIIQNFNAAAVQLFGYQVDEIIGQNITQLVPPHYRQRHQQGLSRFIATEQPRIIGQAVELEGLHKSGQTIPIELTLSAFKWENGYLFTGIIRDISLQKAEHQALIAAKEEAEKANQAKSDFLSAMSHELRTPLNAILGFTHLLRSDDQTPLTATQHDSLEIIEQSGEHLLRLINDLLELAKIETGKVDVSIEPVDIKTTLQHCLPMLKSLADRYRVQIKARDIASQLVLADSTRLKQVLINLISNAIKYNRPNGKVTITTQRLDEQNRLRILIEDTGLGIAQEKQAYLFSAFDRLGQENSGIEGTGVGLVVTQRLIHAMHGTMDFESSEQQGSRFWVELPIATAPSSSQPAAQDTENGDTTTINADNQLILQIEDNPANIKLMEAFFTRLPNYQLHTCKTAEAGLQWLEHNTPAAILMDINLPGINGLQATKHILATPSLRHIPVIAVTAAVMPYDLQQAEGLFTAYLTKPVDFSRLTKLLKRYANTPSGR